MATHSSILVWKITWAEEPGRLHPKGYKESDTTRRARTHTHIHTHTALRIYQAVKKFNLVHWKRRVQLEDKGGAPASSPHQLPAW